MPNPVKTFACTIQQDVQDKAFQDMANFTRGLSRKLVGVLGSFFSFGRKKKEKVDEGGSYYGYQNFQLGGSRGWVF